MDDRPEDTDDIDAWFPESAERARKAQADFQTQQEKTTAEKLQSAFSKDPHKQWKCEDIIKPMLTEFAKHYPECVPRGSKSSIYASARDLLPEVGAHDSAKFVEWACQKIKHEMPEVHEKVKNLRSLMFLVPEWRRRSKDTCLACGLHWSECVDEWGSQRRKEKYGG